MILCTLQCWALKKPATAPIQHRHNNNSSFRDVYNTLSSQAKNGTMEEQQIDRQRTEDKVKGEGLTPRKENRSTASTENGGEGSTKSTDGMTLPPTNDVSSQSNDEDATPSQQNPISKHSGSSELNAIENNSTDQNSNGSDGIDIDQKHDDDDDDHENNVDDQHYGGSSSSKTGHSPRDTSSKALKEETTSNNQYKDFEENNTYEPKKVRRRQQQQQQQGRQRLRPTLPANITRKKRGRVVRLVNIDDTLSAVGKVQEPTPTTHNSTERSSPSMENSTEKPNISTAETEASRLTSSDRIRTTISFPALPDNQYIAVLRRRAIRKLEDATSTTGSGAPSNESNHGKLLHDNDDGQSQQTSSSFHQMNEYGDISLGMKLIVVGGRVIVQSLNPLSNGLASPAQLVGVIQRGDVLLAVGNLSLVNLPVHQLMEGLKPLSTPDMMGRYQEILNLRFESATGFDLLRIHEEGQEALRSQSRPETADAMMSLFPMVDQLSGEPLFKDDNLIHDMISKDEDERIASAQEEQEEKMSEIDPNEVAQIATVKSVESVGDDDGDGGDIYSKISSTLGKRLTVDKMLYESEFFDWREDLPPILRKPSELGDQDIGGNNSLTKEERLELGKKMMQITRSIELNMEEIDKGRDLRSFKTWSTNFSLRSGISARRRFVIDTTSISSRRGTSLDSSGDAESIDSDASGSLDGVDPDTLLLGLAARDEIWRKQVVDVLTHAKERMTDGNSVDVHENDEKKATSTTNKAGIDAALTNHLENFLFGQNISKIVKQEKESYALPPKDVTRVLFDLTTNLATKAPNEIMIFGGSLKFASNLSSVQSKSTERESRSKTALRGDVLLANRFVLDEALPVWLNSFRPLPLDYRRILWPRIQQTTDSTTGTYTGNPSSAGTESDTLSLGSAGSSTQRSVPNKKRDLRERVEEHQIDPETRSETCFLVTHFYKMKVLSSDLDASASWSPSPSDFVEKYGAYLELHSSLTFASSVKNESAIHDLLKAATYDPIHRDTVKEIQKSKDLMFYDPSKLSAVLQFLVKIRFDTNKDRRKVVRDLCVSAYPDILPWQVRSACLEPSLHSSLDALATQTPCSSETMEDLYYAYMTLLLHPNDGNDEARHDANLVEEWCKWSVGILPRPSKDSDRLKNFYLVASRSSTEYKRYRRDLITLLDLAMIIDDTDQAIELIGEILAKEKLLSKQDTVQRSLVHLRNISDKGLVMIRTPSSEAEGFRIIQRILGLFEKMATIQSLISKGSIILSQELYRLLEKEKSLSHGGGKQFYAFLDFIIKSSTSPRDVLRALSVWSTSNDIDEAIYERLQKLLIRGVDFSEGELSGTLIRLRQNRVTFADSTFKPVTDSNTTNSSSLDTPNQSGGIWQKMANGEILIEK